MRAPRAVRGSRPRGGRARGTAPRAGTRLPRNRPREGRQRGLWPQLPTRDRLGGLPAPRAATGLSAAPRGLGRGYRGAEARGGRGRLPGQSAVPWPSGRGCPRASGAGCTPGGGDPAVRARPRGGPRGRRHLWAGAWGPRAEARRPGSRDPGVQRDLGAALRPPGGAVPTPGRGARSHSRRCPGAKAQNPEPGAPRRQAGRPVRGAGSPPPQSRSAGAERVPCTPAPGVGAPGPPP